jgi:hypothetical protein
MNDYVCVIGRFGNLGCNRSKFIAELKLLLPEGVFPWATQQMVFHSESADVEYVFDENMQKIARGYEDSRNEAGLRSLLSVTYNVDTFSSADGLYGKVLLQRSESVREIDYPELFTRVFLVMENHVPLQEGQKVKISLISQKVSDEPDIPPSNREFWMKAIVEYRGNITQHILFGTKGNPRKVHVFRRMEGPSTYENTPRHCSPDIAPFRQIVAAVIQEGVIHSFHVNPQEINPNKGDPKKE